MAAETGDIATVLGENLDAVIAAIDDVEVVVLVKRQPCRSIEFALARAIGAPGRLKLAIAIEDRDAIEPIVRDVYIGLIIICNGVRTVYFAVLLTL
jgi:hypothetical protein